MVKPPIARVLFWTYAAAWTILLLVPDPASFFFVREVVPESIVNAAGAWDKVVHMTGYFGLALLALVAYAAKPGANRSRWLCAVCVIHGALTELGQTMVPPRQGDVADVIADATGVLLAAFLFTLLRRDASATHSTPKVRRD